MSSAPAAYPGCVPGLTDLPAVLQQAVFDSPGPTPEFAARLRGLLPPVPEPAGVPIAA